MIRRPSLGNTPAFCNSLLTAQVSYVPATQVQYDAMIAACDALGVDIRKAPGLLPPAFAGYEENPYYTTYKELAAQTNVEAGEHIPIPINPATSESAVQAVTSLPVYQGTSQPAQPEPQPVQTLTAWNPPAQQNAPPAETVNPTAPQMQEPGGSGTPQDPGATEVVTGTTAAPEDSREVIGGSLIDEVFSALPPELRELSNKLRALPAWVWLAAAAAVLYYLNRQTKGRRR